MLILWYFQSLPYLTIQAKYTVLIWKTSAIQYPKFLGLPLRFQEIINSTFYKWEGEERGMVEGGRGK